VTSLMLRLEESSGCFRVSRSHLGNLAAPLRGKVSKQFEFVAAKPAALDSHHFVSRGVARNCHEWFT
jgi:hypothetical protein